MRLALLALALAGCSGLLDSGGNDGLTDEQVTARRLWFTRALPVLSDNCASCHAGGAGGSPIFMAGTDDLAIRESVLTYDPPVISLDAPGSSYLLTRGVHDGPAFDGAQISAVLEWVLAEKAAGTSDPTTIIQTPKFQPSLCTTGAPGTPTCPINQISLDDVGGTGATFDFVVQSLPDGSYMTDLAITGGATGVYVEHPLFVTWPATPVDGRIECQPDANDEVFCIDVLDRFATSKINVPAAAPAPVPLNPNTTTFTTFVATDMMSLRFTLVGPPQP